MFEGFTLEQQREIECARGWQPTYAALTYCTAEAVVMRHVLPHDILATEVVVAERISGAPDCVGKLQSKWGGYTKPTDQSPMHAMRRTLNEVFGWHADSISLKVTGIIGPWLYKSTLAIAEDTVVLTVSDMQAEQTPFQATLFAVVVPEGYELGQGSYLKTTREARWTTLRDPIELEGKNREHLYWEMTFDCLETIMGTRADCVFHRPPGQYILSL